LIKVHKEPDRASIRTAAEAVIKLFGLTYGERGRFLIVKRAATLQITPPFAERDPGSDYFDDVCASQHIVYEFSRYLATHF
jgi:hypothetical protein